MSFPKSSLRGHRVLHRRVDCASKKFASDGRRVKGGIGKEFKCGRECLLWGVPLNAPKPAGTKVALARGACCDSLVLAKQGPKEVGNHGLKREKFAKLLAGPPPPKAHSQNWGNIALRLCWKSLLNSQMWRTHGRNSAKQKGFPIQRNAP